MEIKTEKEEKLYDDYPYSSYRDGKFVSVPKIDDLCLQLKDKFKRQDEQNQRLREENQKLKEGIWKKEEVARLKKEYEEMKEDYYRGFPISEKEAKKISEWHKTHECSRRGTRSGMYRTYHFFPTELGTSGVVECSCGAKFEFQELG